MSLKNFKFFVLFTFIILCYKCGVYSFTGASIPPGVTTFQVNFFSVTPMSATAENTAAQNRLRMAVAFRFFNVKKEEDNFERTYSFFYDFPAELQVYDVIDSAHKEIFDRITQDIFNDTLAKW